MPNYTFQATDRAGNRVDGTISAPNEALAANQIGQMGYSLVDLRPSGISAAASPASAASPILTAPASAQAPAMAYAGPVSLSGPPPAPTLEMTPATSFGPRPIDLSRPMDEIMASSSAAFAALGTEAANPNITTEMTPSGPLEPWQRGGPVAPAVTQASQMTMNANGVVVSRTQPMAAGGGPASVPAGRETSRSSEKAPYGNGAAESTKPLPQRFMEVMIYPIFSGVVLKDLAAFYRQFATLIGAGIPLFQALTALEGNTKNSRLQEVARAGQRQVQAGGHFSDVLAAWPWIFQPVQVALLRAAEQGGMLEETLRQVADYVEHDLEVKRLISRETTYPKIVMFVAFMIIGRSGFSGGAMAVVQLVLGGMGKGSYSLLQYLLDTIGFGLFCLSFLFVPMAIFRLGLFNVKGFRESFDAFKLAIPGLGKTIKMFALARFGRTLAALYRGGFGLGYALDIAGDAAGNAVLQETVRRAVGNVERGGLASDALKQGGFFPPMALDMFRTGETSGRLDEMLDRMADFYESEGKLKTHQNAMIFGTAVFLIVAIFVAVQIISFYTGYGQGVAGGGGGE